MPSQVIQMLLPDGNPNGVKVIGLSNFAGKAFIIPRAKLNEVRDREEANRPAVYFLFGESDDPARKKVYIGESESFYSRLTSHDDTKDFWNIAVVFIGENLNRAHVKYLENKAISLAKKVDRNEVVNHAEPQENRLNEFERNVAEEFFEKIKFILTLTGFTIFEEVIGEKQANEIYYLSDVNNKDADGRGALLESGEFVVFAGSKARVHETPGFIRHVGSSLNLRRRLEAEGVFKKQADEKSFIFTKDYVFTSPSAAADVVHGRACNGWTGWKDKDGKTLDENKRS